MLLFVMLLIKYTISSTHCSSPAPKIIKTLIASDSNVTYKLDSNSGFASLVQHPVWNKISGSDWIWYLPHDTLGIVVEFSKTFYVPGRILIGKFEFLVDNILNDLTLNGFKPDYPKDASFIKVATSTFDDFIISGYNTLIMSVENSNPSSVNPAGICFLITIWSEILV